MEVVDLLLYYGGETSSAQPVWARQSAATSSPQLARAPLTSRSPRGRDFHRTSRVDATSIAQPCGLDFHRAARVGATSSAQPAWARLAARSPRARPAARIPHGRD